jgi:RNA polymerase sigma factor (TIGR02999 family)
MPSPSAEGGREAVDGLFAAAYEELKRLASVVRRSERSLTLTPTALVNEAWLKLSASPALGRLSCVEFKRVAARAMRQVLIEAARKRMADKRGGGIALVTFDEALDEGATTPAELLELHEALDALGHANPRQAALVEARFFGGLETAELAELLDVSEATVLRDWRAARAWLSHELGRSARER